ncbi:SH3 domain-containing protein [Streptomyces sp. NPDC049879]|uniref:SH3 domain-containing protein n=1 Tax=Streptomyces sp. NPDC049879 TaxID=3365598 RepID=UPI0037B4451A
MKISRRAKLAAAVLPLAFTATSLVTAPAATAGEAGADACQKNVDWSNKDSGIGFINNTKYVSGPLRTGPNAGCPAVETLWAGNAAYYHCYVLNSAGNTWSHVRIVVGGTSYNGWIWDEYLDDGGSTKLC